MAKDVLPFLMFEGRAEEAMNFYTTLLPGSEIGSIVRYGPGNQNEGKVQLAKFTVGTQAILCTDSPVNHAFTFTPSISLFIECDSEHEINRLYSAMENGGEALMPIDNYGFSQRFGWLKDKFGVSWQVNWA